MKRAPGDRERLEQALPPGLIGALRELQTLLDVVDWRLTPLGPPFTAAAILLRAAELIRAGYAPTRAVDVAAVALGVPPETMRTWARRWPDLSRGVQPEHTYRGVTAQSLAEDEAHSKAEVA